jgi:hypothetical protein
MVSLPAASSRQQETHHVANQQTKLSREITELARSSTATNMPKAMDTMGFLDSFVKAVLPHLRPFPQPNSVVVCDNATLHHDQLGWLEQLVHSRGAIIIYLPPYACDLNPIESELTLAWRCLLSSHQPSAQP